MTNEALIQVVEELITPLLEANPAHFLVDIRIKPTNNIKIFIDGDQGVGIDELVRYNRALYKVMEEKAYFPEGDFSLEVSSPGLDEPLKLDRQYIKNVGRYAEVILKEGQKIEGKITGVNETDLLLEEDKVKLNKAGQPIGKKKEIVNHSIPLSTIKTTKIQIKF